MTADETVARLDADGLAALLRSIQSVSDVALAHQRLDAMLEPLVLRLRELLGVDSVRLLLRDAQGDGLAVRAALGPGDDRSQATRAAGGGGVAGRVAEQRQAVLVDDLASSGAADAPARGGSAMAAPLRIGSELIGVLEVGSTAPGRFTDSDLAMLQMLGDQVALAIDRATQLERAERSELRLADDSQRCESLLARQADLVAQLQQERAQLDGVLQQMPAGVLIVEAPSGRVIRGNARIEEILGRDAEGVRSLAGFEQAVGSRPDGTPIAAEEWPLARALTRGETVEGEEILYARGDGTAGWIRIDAAPVRDDQGRIVAAVAVVNDIEREKHGADELRFLADVSSALHATLDYRATLRQVARLAVPRFADWCVIDLVDAAGGVQRQEAAHRDPAVEARIKQLQAQYPTRYDDPAHPVGRTLRTGEPTLITDAPPDLPERIGQDDEHAEILRSLGLRSLIVVPVRGRDRILGTMGFATAESNRRFDESDLALAEEIAQRSAVAIENAELFGAASEASQAKTEFLAVMSHELRTPLAAIMGYAELLQMGIPVALPEPALRQVERIDSAARHQLQLIEEILTYSRLSAGQEVMVAALVDVAVPVREAVAFIEPAADKKGLGLHVRLPAEACEIETDASKLRQLLVNLLFNAVQFTAQGEIRVEIEPRDDDVRIHVQDTGIGIATEDHRKIFEPFWQVRQSSTREVGGTGLGLTVAQRMLEVLGGELTVESEVGRGSRFTAQLPRTAALARERSD